MLIREAIEDRLSLDAGRDPEGVEVRLPLSLKTDRVPVRTGMFQRLAASRQFALGDRSGVLRAAQGRSGRAFRMDVRQRVIVKALVSRHVGMAATRAGALAAHVAYLGRSGAGVEGARPNFFDRADDRVEASLETRGWSADRHHFRFIISPEHGDRIADLTRSGKAVHLSLTKAGKAAAKALTQSDAFADLIAHMQVVAEAFSDRTGTELKNLIYATFGEDISDRPLGHIIGGEG